MAVIWRPMPHTLQTVPVILLLLLLLRLLSRLQEQAALTSMGDELRMAAHQASVDTIRSTLQSRLPPMDWVDGQVRKA